MIRCPHVFAFPLINSFFSYQSAIPQLIGCIKSFLRKVVSQQIRNFHLLVLVNIGHQIDYMLLILI